MPTTRTPIRRQGIRGKITPEAVALYRQLRKIHDSGDEERWREASDLRSKLDQVLGRTEPWLENIFWVIGDDTPPDWMTQDQDRVRRWHEAKQVLTALEQADAGVA